MFYKLKQVIEFYGWCLGQKVSWEKSALCGINIEVFPMHAHGCNLYLGLSLGGYPRQVSFWQPDVQTFKRGRATLCKLVLSSLPTYFISSFLMPEGVISSLERILRNFFWEGHNGIKVIT